MDSIPGIPGCGIPHAAPHSQKKKKNLQQTPYDPIWYSAVLKDT